METLSSHSPFTHFPDAYILPNFHISSLNHSFILQHSAAFASTSKRAFFEVHPESIEINAGVFIHPNHPLPFPTVVVTTHDHTLAVSCACVLPKKRLCEHQVQVLLNIIERPTLKAFFDEKLRDEKIREVAGQYGLENEPNLDEVFEIHYAPKTLDIRPKTKELFPVSPASQAYAKEQLLAEEPSSAVTATSEGSKQIVVLGKHKYYEHFYIELFEAHTTKEGKVKAPLTSLAPLDKVFQTESVEELRFYTAISRFQQPESTGKSLAELEGLKALVKNPLGLDIYFHDLAVSSTISPSSIVQVQLRTLNLDITVQVDFKDKYHEVVAQLIVNDTKYDLKDLKLKFDYFLLIGNALYLIDNPHFVRVVDFFKKHHHKLLIHKSKFEEFKKDVLSLLEHHVRINYSHIRPATPKQIEEIGFDAVQQRVIYLSESQDFVHITPVLKYGEVEVPVLSKKQIYGLDKNGNEFVVSRDEEAETAFVALLLRQHPHFQEQLHSTHFSLHKKRFLEEEWFLETFEEWRGLGIAIFGFNQLKDNSLNPHKAKVSILVTTGINWFETNVGVAFGKQKVALKHLQKAIRNKTQYIPLDDGTLGILPKEWIEKFAQFFHNGNVVGETIKTPFYQYDNVRETYDDVMLSAQVKEQLATYAAGFEKFESIKEVNIPKTLKATLRDYQKQGLNWLHFLDEFGFGGCLADDMGLGKTIQVIAFLLSLKEAKPRRPHLIVVPTTLIANWQNEIKQFAPSLKVHEAYGVNRRKDTDHFEGYDVVLTTYGMLLADIGYLKEFAFDYVFLDESQAIKNPESQRYLAACQLQSRNRVVLTGTPIENNTFDLYGQLSFACPGLLGHKQYFKDLYSMPIDTFGDSRRAKELQRKINPFILRRTKKQVATELPEKTEMILYCEMGEEQRKIYQAYEQEIRDYIKSKPEDNLAKESMHVLKGITKLRQICNSASLIRDETFYGQASAKMEALLEQIENKSPQHKILVFSQFVSMLDLIKKELVNRQIPFQYLTGQTTRRADKVQDFQENENIRVFLISLKAGGVGLNLTQADYVYLVDPWWNPAVENQAIDRSYRIGQTKHVIAVRLICPGTIEEKMMKLQHSKKELADGLIKTDVAVLKSLSKKELVGLFE